jgi:hypothetical protein
LRNPKRASREPLPHAAVHKTAGALAHNYWEKEHNGFRSQEPGPLWRIESESLVPPDKPPLKQETRKQGAAATNFYKSLKIMDLKSPTFRFFAKKPQVLRDFVRFQTLKQPALVPN